MSEHARAVETLFNTATTLCKLDVLENEGGAILSANVPGTTTINTQKEIENLSASFADLYIRTLKKVKKRPRQEVEIKLRKFCDTNGNQLGIRAVFPVIMQHLNRAYLGMPIVPADVRQDFQSLRYGSYLPVRQKIKQ